MTILRNNENMSAGRRVWDGVGWYGGSCVTPTEQSLPKESGVAVDTARWGAGEGAVVGAGAERLGRAWRAEGRNPRQRWLLVLVSSAVLSPVYK